MNGGTELQGHLDRPHLPWPALRALGMGKEEGDPYPWDARPRWDFPE